MQGKIYGVFGRLQTRDADCKYAAIVLGEECDEDITLVTGAALQI